MNKGRVRSSRAARSRTADENAASFHGEPDSAVNDEAGFAADHDRLPFVLAPEVATARGELAAVKLPLAHPFGPVGDDDAVRGAADWVFRQADIGRENANDDIRGGIARRGRDDSIAVESRHARQIG